jgi:hypothetical protein
MKKRERKGSGKAICWESSEEKDRVWMGTRMEKRQAWTRSVTIRGQRKRELPWLGT